MPLAFIADKTSSIAPRDALFLVRWITLVLLGLAVLEPQPTRVGLPMWGFVLLFAVYSLAIDLLGRRRDWVRSRLQPVLDLVLAGMLYLLNTRVEGATYTLVFLAVVSASATLPSAKRSSTSPLPCWSWLAWSSSSATPGRST